MFGHDWGRPRTERDRQTDGEEVVVTVREVRTCGRCGASEVLGESMEVTAVEPADADPPADPTERPGTVTDSDDARTDDGVILDEEASEDGRDFGEWPDRPERQDVERSVDPPPWPDPAAEQVDGERAGGRWPADRDDGTDDGTGERPPAGTDDGPVGDPDRDDGAASDPPDAGVAVGERPDDDAEVLTTTDGTGESRSTDSEPVDPAQAGDPTDQEDPESEAYYCPECGFVHDEPNPSFRAGDICPNCRNSYLAAREQ